MFGTTDGFGLYKLSVWKRSGVKFVIASAVVLALALLFQTVAVAEKLGVDHYLLADRDMRISVTVSMKGWNLARTETETCLHGSVYRQKLILLSGMWLGAHKDYGPAVFLWHPAHDHVFVVLQSADVGVMDDRLVTLYRWRHHRWDLTNSASTFWQNRTAFSGRGGFYVSGNSLYIWDFVFDDHFALFAPARYKLRIYTWDHGRLIGPEIKTTKRKYDVTRLGVGCSAPNRSEDDPLREFGMSWPKTVK